MHESPLPPLKFVVLHWYRPNPTRRLLRVWLLGSGLALVGLLIGGLRFLQPLRGSDEAQAASLILGLLITMSGLIWAVLGALRTLRDDTCLLVRNDGIQITDPPRFLPWDTILTVEHLPNQSALQITLPPPAPPLLIDARFSPDLLALARLLTTTQRRALMGLIKSPPR